MDQKICVVIVTYNSANVIANCIESLLGSTASRSLRVVVADNSSRDETAEIVRRLIERSRSEAGLPEDWLTFLPLTANKGYAHALNRGIEVHFDRSDMVGFWILNPDCVVPPETAGRLLDFARSQEFGLASGRCRYHEMPEIIQTDGGRVSRVSGVCSSVNMGRKAAETPLPDPETLDFLTGAHLMASRRFIEEVGLMPEEYFLYYEEVDWAFRRKKHRLHLVEGADVLHHGGTSIGSGGRKRPATAFANYFNHRSRARFVRRYFPLSAPAAYTWSALKAAQVLLKDGRREAAAIVHGVLGLGPTKTARDQNPSAFEQS
jgi:GT2 family glycosyltransferase